jgi:hypothetical protein
MDVLAGGATALEGPDGGTQQASTAAGMLFERMCVDPECSTSRLLC